MKSFQDFLHIMDFSGNQTVQGPNKSFSAASKGFKRHQMMNKGLIKQNGRLVKKKKTKFKFYKVKCSPCSIL